MSTTTRKVVIAGVMGAISIFLGATHLGFVPWMTGAALTPMHIPVIIGAILEGPWVGAAIGFLFGAFSLLQGAIAPTGPADVWFTNPLISILPRLFIGPVAWLVYRVLRAMSQRLAFVLAAAAGAAYDVILLLVVLALHRFQPTWLDSRLPWVLLGIGGILGAAAEAWLVYKVLQGDQEPTMLTVAAIAGSLTNTILVLAALGLFRFLQWPIIATIGVFNGLPEAVAAAVITVAVVVAWKRIETGRKGSTV